MNDVNEEKLSPYLIVSSNGKKFEVDIKLYESKDEAYAKAHDVWKDSGNDWETDVVSIQQALSASQLLSACKAALVSIQGADDLLEKKLREAINRAEGNNGGQKA